MEQNLKTIQMTDANVADKYETDSLKDKKPHQSPHTQNNFEQPSPDPVSSPDKLTSQKAITIANPIELTWRNLNIDAFVKKTIKGENGKKKTVTERRQILKNLSGTLKPGQFTAILGPSGCGKTTLLNFLSGRLVANNMEISGSLLLNSTEITDIDDYSNQIAYVMQDDILLATFTPTEAFKFSADLRLKHLNGYQKMERVMRLIKELGLTKCKDTKIGNAMIRGVSGGERKRTSIGVELLTNPAMLFLDEPTTGLDSSTALQVVELLKTLSHRGVNVVSTIHQPSSEIFDSFERLILLVRGNIIYQGNSQDSVDYFTSLGHKCPDFSNPSDYFMKLMNEEGLLIELMQKGEAEELTDEQINEQFEHRLENMVTKYFGSDMVAHLDPTFNSVLQKNDDSFNVSIIIQFLLLLKRAFISQIRNPMDVFMKSLQMVIFAIATLIVFQPLGDGSSGIQNRSGVLFFLATMSAFSSIQGSIATFSIERPLFLRERLNKSYSVGPYFWGKNLAEFPFHILYPILTIVITYFSIGLNDSSAKYFFILNAAMICTFFYGTSYGLMISVIIPKMEVAMALVPILVIPFMVLGGFFVNSNNIPKYLIWIEYVSMFKYGFQAAVLNEFDTVNFTCAGCDPLAQLGIKETMAENFIALIALGVGFRIIAYIFMHLISTPKRPKLNEKKAVKA